MTQVIGPDESRGHIVITHDGAVSATACDMGPHLTLWTYQGINLTPAAARNLAQALSDWADRQHDHDDRHPDEVLIEAIEGTCPHDCETGLGDGRWRCTECGRVERHDS